jgi:hypothetical protein
MGGGREGGAVGEGGPLEQVLTFSLIQSFSVAGPVFSDVSKFQDCCRRQ